MKKSVFLIVTFLYMVMISGCSSIEIKSPTELIKKPKLEVNQEKIRQVIEQVLPEKTKLLSVNQDDQMGAINFADIDGDGEDEAIVFYKSLEKEYLLGLTILKHTEQGWVKLDEKSEVASDIDFIDFSDITGDGTSDLIVGFAGDDEFDKYLVVYSIQAGEIARVFEKKYEKIIVTDFENRGTNDLIITQVERNVEAKIQLYRGKKGEVELTDELIFEDYVNQFDSMKLTNIGKAKGFVVDYKYGNYTSVSTVIKVENGKLKDLLADEYSNEYYSKKYKTYYIESTDIDENGVVEIGNYVIDYYDPNDTAKTLLVEEWYQCTEDGKLERIKQSYSDEKYNFRFIFPNRWMDKVHIERNRAKGVEDSIGIVLLNEKTKKYEPLYAIDIYKVSEWDELKLNNQEKTEHYMDVINDMEYAYAIREVNSERSDAFYTNTKISVEELKNGFRLFR